MRTFESKLAIRESVPLLVGIFGCSGSGKTYSALELATGMQSVFGGSIQLIDTEAKRALHYADKFKFNHIPFEPPFSPDDYLSAIEYAIAQNPGVVVIDSMSHEHTGPGGVLEIHDAELDRMAGTDWKRRESCSMAGWIKPKAMRRKFVQRLLQVGNKTAFIFCFRAKEVTKPMRNDQGKTEIVKLGFMPEGGTEYVYEMTAACLLPPVARGLPDWKPEFQGEQMVTKLPDQFLGILNDGKPLNADHGKKLASWAKGDTAAKPSAPLSNLPPTWNDWTLEEQGSNRAHNGAAALQAWWASLSTENKKRLKPTLDSEWKTIAANVQPSNANL